MKAVTLPAESMEGASYDDSKYVNADIFDLMERGFENLHRVSLESIREAELRSSMEDLPEERDENWY